MIVSKQLVAAVVTQQQLQCGNSSSRRRDCSCQSTSEYYPMSQPYFFVKMTKCNSNSLCNAQKRSLSSLADFSFKPCTAPMSNGFTWRRKSVQLHLRFAAAGGVGGHGDGRVAPKLRARFRVPKQALLDLPDPSHALRLGSDAFIPNLEEVRAPVLLSAGFSGALPTRPNRPAHALKATGEDFLGPSDLQQRKNRLRKKEKHVM